MTRSFLQNNYSNCPLKKRPFVFDLEEDVKSDLKTEHVTVDSHPEPENLSTKPQDLTVSSSSVPKVISPPPIVPIHHNSRTLDVEYYPLQHPKNSGPLEPISLNLPASLPYSGWHRGIPYPPFSIPVFPNGQQELYSQYQHLYPVSNPNRIVQHHREQQHQQHHRDHHQQRYHGDQQQLYPYSPSRDSISPSSTTAVSPPLQRPPPDHLVHHYHSIPTPILRHHSPPSMPQLTELLHNKDCYISSGGSTSPSMYLSGTPPSSPSPPAEDLSPSSSKRPIKDYITSRYQCPDCNKSYSTYSGLTKHQQFHCVTQTKKSFCCKYCEKVYMSLGALKMHIRTHTLPCKCTLCGKAFSRPWLLQGHIRTHTGAKPFSCQHCNRAFADRSNLRAHMQTHSDVKKYSCKTCSKTFSRMSLLVKHEGGGCPGNNYISCGQTIS